MNEMTLQLRILRILIIILLNHKTYTSVVFREMTMILVTVTRTKIF